MKKSIQFTTLFMVFSTLFFLSGLSFAEDNIFPATGNVGIGTTIPNTDLEVNGVIKSGNSYINVLSVENCNSYTNGVKIKTKIPFQNGPMQAVIIEGYDYSSYNTIGISVSWHTWGNNYIHSAASSWGGTAPQITLATENGFTTIHLAWTPYCAKYSVRVVGVSSASWYEGWTISDEVAGTANQIIVSYNINLPGTVDFAEGVWGANGNVGIGTKNPEAALHIYTPNTDLDETVLKIVHESHIQKVGARIELGSRYSTSATTRIIGYSYPYHTHATQLVLQTMDPNGQTWHSICMDENGNLGIGTSNPANKLDVNGTIRAKEVKVETNWSDFVFEENYNLPTLDKVESYIKENKHLPDVPSAKQVEDEGLSVSDMLAKQMQKIEELTLYMIEQNKRIESVESENKRLKDQIKELKTMN